MCIRDRIPAITSCSWWSSFSGEDQATVWVEENWSAQYVFTLWARVHIQTSQKTTKSWRGKLMLCFYLSLSSIMQTILFFAWCWSDKRKRNESESFRPFYRKFFPWEIFLPFLSVHIFKRKYFQLQRLTGYPNQIVWFCDFFFFLFYFYL